MITEEHFWMFCDHYLELVKVRSYGDISQAGTLSALATLQHSISIFLRLLAPVVPYITEEVWQWCFGAENKFESIHRCKWPSVTEFNDIVAPSDVLSFDTAVNAVGLIRGAKSDKKVGQRTEVVTAKFQASEQGEKALSFVITDVMACGNVTAGALLFQRDDNLKGSELRGEFELAAPPQ
jgi:valyl-tRNA synthetase